MLSIQRADDRSVEHRQCRFQVALEMHPQRAPAAFGEHVEITARLRRLDDAETGLLAGHGEIVHIIGGYLHEYSARGAPLLCLAPRLAKEACPLTAACAHGPVAEH